MKLVNHLLIIDPQNDFCNPNGSLFVPGADKDMQTLARFIKTHRTRFDDVHVSLDSHHRFDIAHPMAWLGSDGKHPSPFTIITSADIKAGKWRAVRPGLQARFTQYVEDLEARQRYPHVIWPEHCLIGSEGASISPVLFESLVDWESQIAMVDYITKGSNPFSEHFSIVQAEVPDPSDPSTQLNTQLINSLSQADRVFITGQALSHCVANTVIDIANAFPDELAVKKLVLLRDTTSLVPNPPGTTLFSDFTDDFLKSMQKRGMTVTTTDAVTW